MMWTVMSNRLAWPAGTVLGAADLSGCNIDVLVQGGHLAPVENYRTPSEQKPDSPRKISKVKPVDPAANDDSAEEPEEQE
jgi:hypothetical protein